MNAQTSKRTRVTVLGSTGSIGKNTLDVIARHPERFEIHALTASRQVDLLLEQCLRFSPRFAVLLDAELAKLPAERRARGTVVVLHQMGSHGPAYHKRTPKAFKVFQPECTQTSLAACSLEEVRNAYDNTIVYTDHFLARTIDWLRARADRTTPALLYVSDHGESLGENNLYLHGLPYAVAPQTQTRVPWITWLSSDFEGWRGSRIACLQRERERALSHDHLFHSVLGLMGVGTEVYQRELDAYAACASR